MNTNPKKFLQLNHDIKGPIIYFFDGGICQSIHKQSCQLHLILNFGVVIENFLYSHTIKILVPYPQMRRITNTNCFFRVSELTFRSLNGELPSRKCSIKAPTKYLPNEKPSSTTNAIYNISTCIKSNKTRYEHHF